MTLKRIVLIVACVLFIGAAGIIFMFKSWNGLVGDSNKKVIEDGAFTKVEILADNAAVEIVPGKDSVTTVEYSGKTRKKSKYILKADVKGDTLFVQFKEKRRGFFHFGISSFDLQLTVKVPEKQYGRIKAESDNGRIKAEHIHTEELVLRNGQWQYRIEKY